MSPCLRRCVACAVVMFACWTASTRRAAAQPPVTVTAADPSVGEQETVGLVVKVKGKNFAAGARAEFLRSGTSDPAGITVHSTRHVSATEVEATIDIAAGAALSLFDIRVTNTNGRSGKGSDLFQVVEKGARGQASCTLEPLDTSRFDLVGTLNTAVSGIPMFQQGFGVAAQMRRMTLDYGGLGTREVLLLAVGTTDTTARVEIFFLDPLTGVVLDGSPVVAGGPVQPHVTVHLLPLGADAKAGQIALGDVDADGVPDIVTSGHNGYGGLTLLRGHRDVSGVIGYSASLLPRPAKSTRLGLAIALGNLDADAGDEIVATQGSYMQGKKGEPGRLHVYDHDGVLLQSLTEPQGSSLYGWGLALGDLTGDGRLDAAVGVPGESVGGLNEAGAVLVYAGTGAAPALLAAAPLRLNGPSPAASQHFGHRVAVGNLDGVTAPGVHDDALAFVGEAGAAVFPGPIVASGQTSVPALDLTLRTDLTGGWITRNAAIADLDGNGLLDVVGGAPNTGCNSVGVAYVFLAQGTLATATTGWTRHTIFAPTRDPDFAAFGWSTAAVDGSPLVVVGEHGRDVGSVTGAGQVYIYRVKP